MSCIRANNSKLRRRSGFYWRECNLRFCVALPMIALFRAVLQGAAHWAI